MNSLMEAVIQFHFLRPWWLIGLVPCLILFTLLLYRKANFGAWQKIVSPHLLPHLISGYVSKPNPLPLTRLMVGWIICCLALAGPTWKKLPLPTQKKINAQVILLDLSLSMYAKDLSPSRLIRARMKLTDILNKSQEGLTALVVYAGSPHVVTPLTDDTNTILSMVNSLTPEIMPLKGSDPTAAVRKAVDLLKQGGLTNGQLVLITDHLPANFTDEVAAFLPTSTPLSILGVGTKQGAPIELPDGSFVKGSDGSIVIPKLNTAVMRKAARQLNGRFSRLRPTEWDVNYLLANRSELDEKLKESDRQYDTWKDRGHWLALLLLPIAALCYRRGWLGVIAMPMVASTLFFTNVPTAQAFEWKNLWQTQNQQGQALFESGEPEHAADVFSDPSWKGSSYYKSGDYQMAEQYFSQLNDAEGHYNLGNAQAMQKKFDQAIASYERALELDPNFEDARVNLEQIKELEKQQSQQNQGDSQKQDSGDQSDQKQSNEEQQDNKQSQQDGDSQEDQAEREQQANQQQEQDSQSESQDQQDSQKNSQAEQQDKNAEQPRTQSGEQQENTENSPENKPQAEDSQLSVRTEDQEAMEQWLRRVPDDPGGLLRRKFRQQSRNLEQAPRGESAW